MAQITGLRVCSAAIGDNFDGPVHCIGTNVAVMNPFVRWVRITDEPTSLKLPGTHGP